MRTHIRSDVFRVMFLTLLALLAISASIAQEKEKDSKAQANPAQPKVRTITAFINIDRSRYQIDIADAVKFLKYARTVYESRGYTVQTLRIATQPFPEYTKGISHDEALRFFKNLDGIAQQENLVISIGPAYLTETEPDAQAELLVDAIRNTKNIYGSLAVTKDDSINWAAVNTAARSIKGLADTTAHSEGNFHFAAIAGVPPYSPFFPAAYHTGAGHQFAVGLESANSVKEAFEDAPDQPTARRRLIDLMFDHLSDVEHLAQRIDREQGWIYMGIDESPAPMRDVSIGAAIETLTKQPFGSSGTMTAAGTITSALKEIGVRKTGYSGLMLPILEDARLAQRYNEGNISIDGLLSYSAVCGTGLDTMPFPGDISVEALARIIGDVATLSLKWNKPLSARLLPVTGKHAGEMTEFSDPALINVTLRPFVSK
jgi:uncharacterized protein